MVTNILIFKFKKNFFVLYFEYDLYIINKY